MAVTQKSLRTVQHVRSHNVVFPQRLYAVTYAITLILAAVAIYIVVGLVLGKASILLDDIRYGRPRTTQLDAFVGHEETSGQPTHIIALNLNRQVSIIELPGGDPSKMRTMIGPYLFGAEEDLTPVLLSLRDLDGDGQLDLLLDVRQEQIVYLNKDGVFRLPTPEEQSVLLAHGSGQ